MYLKTAALLVVALSGGACSRRADGPTQAIVGAMLIDGTARPPVESSVVLIAGNRIQALGGQGEVKVPSNAVRFPANGRFVFPLDPSQPLKRGGPADLVILSVNPALDPDYGKKSVGRMQGGRWIQYPQ